MVFLRCFCSERRAPLRCGSSSRTPTTPAPPASASASTAAPTGPPSCSPRPSPSGRAPPCSHTTTASSPTMTSPASPASGTARRSASPGRPDASGCSFSMSREVEVEPEPQPEPMEVSDDVKERKERKAAALKEKEAGNASYKKKDFETAIQHYTKAMELDDEDISYLTNRAAVYIEMGKYGLRSDDGQSIDISESKMVSSIHHALTSGWTRYQEQWGQRALVKELHLGKQLI